MYPLLAYQISKWLHSIHDLHNVLVVNTTEQGMDTLRLINQKLYFLLAYIHMEYC